MFQLSLCCVVFCTAVASVSAATVQDLSWPRIVKTDDVKFTLYQPQIDKMERNKVQLNLAFSARVKDADDDDTPLYGAINAQCILETHKDQQPVLCKKLKINTINFPAKPNAAESIKEALTDSIAGTTLTLSYDQLQAGLRVAKIIERPHKTNFSHKPPKIYVVFKPMALITIDGNPVLRAVKDTGLMRIVNTPFVILFDPINTQYFLRSSNNWHTSDDLYGNWELATNLPADILKIQDQFTDSPKSGANIKNFIVTTTPAALLEIKGKPELEVIPGTDLYYVKNTDAKILVQTTSQRVFALISGRWFSANALKTRTEWTYVAGSELPESFHNIPENLPISDVLASVPGTQAAAEAVIRNKIPETKKFAKKSLHLQLKFDGRPQFEEIPGTELKYTINSNKPVIRLNNRFFANDQSVWFVANSIRGPWEVADSIPHVLYDIPPDNPLYHLTYCYIFSADDDSVTTGCTPGYQNSYVQDGVVVYGTGYRYIPWVGNEYYGAPFSYGFEYQYDPYYGWYSQAPYIWFATASYASAIGNAIWHRPEHHHRQKIMVKAEPTHNALYTTNHGNVYRQHGKNAWQRHTQHGWQSEHNAMTTRYLRNHYQARYRSAELYQQRMFRPIPKRRYYYYHR